MTRLRVPARMTKRQRAQVVELLRCTADDGKDGGLFNTSFGGEWPTNDDKKAIAVHCYAVHARQSVEAEHPWTLSYDETCLEAALRVEQGELL